MSEADARAPSRDIAFGRLETAGAVSWPKLAVPREVLRAGLERWLALKGSQLDAAQLDLGELFIGFACVQNFAPAIRAFERHYVTSALRAVASYRLDHDELNEVRQRVWIRLMVYRRDNTPVLLHSVGSGRLGGLVRVVMVREALRLRSSSVPELLPLPGVVVAAHDPDPERAAVADQRRSLAKSAFEGAAADLNPRQRLVLRLHYARGVSGAKIGQMYGVHRGTAARWLVSARSDLRVAFLKHLRTLAPELIHNGDEDIEAWFNTHVELSMSRVLGERR